VTISSSTPALAGTTALVTGSTRGLGRAIAQAFAAAGANLVLMARDSEALERQASELRASGVRVWSFAFDLARVEEIPEMYTGLVREVGEVNALVNVAGVNSRSPAVDFPLDEWRRVLDVNLTAPFVLCQCFARELIGRGAPGKVVNIASLLTQAARPMIVAYTASKGGVGQLTKALAVEWAPHRINVNAVGPGYFRTDMNRPLFEDPAFNQWVIDRTPMRRWGEPEDLAGAVVFLASPAADYITGQVLYVDGGWLANL
jgi:gluconate 5-dehydrogenase